MHTERKTCRQDRNTFLWADGRTDRQTDRPPRHKVVVVVEIWAGRSPPPYVTLAHQKPNTPSSCSHSLSPATIQRPSSDKNAFSLYRQEYIVSHPARTQTKDRQAGGQTGSLHGSQVECGTLVPMCITT